MTATATPGRELLALADWLVSQQSNFAKLAGDPVVDRWVAQLKTWESLTRLAAKPADTLDTPRVLEVIRSRWNFEETEFDAIENVLSDAECLVAIRALSTTGEPKQ